MDTKTPVTIIGPDEPDPTGFGESEDRKPEQLGTPKPSSGIAGIPTIDPFNVKPAGSAGNAAIGDTPGKRGRGRPPGSRNKTADQKTPVSGDIKVSIEDLLISCHEMMAAFFGADELELDEEEAKQGAHHIKEVSKLYNHTFNPATLVWMGLVMWLLTVYGTRGVAIYKRVTASKPGPAKVVQMPAPKPDAKPAPNPQPPTKANPLEGVTNPSQLWDEAPSMGND